MVPTPSDSTSLNLQPDTRTSAPTSVPVAEDVYQGPHYVGKPRTNYSSSDDLYMETDSVHDAASLWRNEASKVQNLCSDVTASIGPGGDAISAAKELGPKLRASADGIATLWRSFGNAIDRAVIEIEDTDQDNGNQFSSIGRGLGN